MLFAFSHRLRIFQLLEGCEPSVEAVSVLVCKYIHGFHPSLLYCDSFAPLALSGVEEQNTGKFTCQAEPFVLSAVPGPDVVVNIKQCSAQLLLPY